MFDMPCCDDMTERGGRSISSVWVYGASIDLGWGAMAKGSSWEEDATGRREAGGGRLEAGGQEQPDGKMHEIARCVDVV